SWSLFWLLFVVGTFARAEPPVEVIPLTVCDGRCECVLPTPHADDKYYLIVGSLARELGPHRVDGETGTTTDPESLPRETTKVADCWVRRTPAVSERLEKVRADQPTPHEYRRSVDPPKQRTFHLFVGERDPLDAASYVAVTADLHGTGA